MRLFGIMFATCTLFFSGVSEVLGASVSFSNHQLRQGDTLAVRYHSVEGEPGPILSGFGKKVTMSIDPQDADRQHFVAYLGIAKTQKPGTYTIIISDSAFSEARSVRVQKTAFKTGYITLTPQKQKLQKDTRQLEKEVVLIEKAYAAFTQEQQFDTSFSKPANGPVSSPFGSQRMYNGQVVWTHNGTDIAAAAGSPVRCPAAGTVILSERFRTHGNTVMLDHGAGVVTIYCHMSEIKVSTGQQLQPGDLLGYVGQTGISSGPHLHWGMSVHGVRVNPMFWLEGASGL